MGGEGEGPLTQQGKDEHIQCEEAAHAARRLYAVRAG